MKVLLVNGSPHQKGCTYTALSEVAEALHNEGIETDIYWIGNKDDEAIRTGVEEACAKAASRALVTRDAPPTSFKNPLIFMLWPPPSFS